MHGVRRGRRLQGEAAEAERERARIEADLLRKALAERQVDRVGAWRTTAAAVETNPDEYSLWAFRRSYLLEVEENFEDLWAAELTLTMRALKRHPKAYPAWEHRLWLLGAGSARVDSATRAQRLAEEEKLSAGMLGLDARNFHGWTHRMHVRALSGKSTVPEMQKELEFVTSKINADFANYSAWHMRSKILPLVREVGPELLAEELEFVRQAFYTEPDVQSAWFYHRWLLAGMPGSHGRVSVGEDLWVRELKACDELLELEPEARWVLHAKAHILTHLRRNEDAAQAFRKLKDIVSISFCFLLAEGCDETTVIC